MVTVDVTRTFSPDGKVTKSLDVQEPTLTIDYEALVMELIGMVKGLGECVQDLQQRLNVLEGVQS